MPKFLPKVSIAIINYNGSEFIERCLASIFALSYENFSVVVIDQGSTDNSLEIIKKNFKEVEIIRNKNTGYAGGANKAFKLTYGEFLIIMNEDVIFDQNYVSNLVKRFQKDERIGAVTGKIYKYDFHTNKKTNIIDSVGLLSFKNRRIIDKGQGHIDKGQYNNAMQLFGVSGCCSMYRRKALLDIKVMGEIWDNDFFMYKEDIDISWRLNLRKWQCFFEPTAIAYHRRGTNVLKRYSTLDIIKHRKSVPKLARYCSYKNQRLMQVKNEIFSDLKSNFTHLLIREILTLGYLIFLEPRTLKSVLSFFKQLPHTLKKRKLIQKNKKITSMSHFFQNKPTNA